MSIEARMKAVIENRTNSFYDMFDEYMADDERYFTQPDDPNFDFIEKYDADGNPVINDTDKANAYKKRMARLNAVRATVDANSNIYYTQDESSEFFGYTYDEIIGMANNGVTIPDEILDWAYSMNDASAVDATTETEGASAHDLYTSLKNNPLLNIKTITKIFVNKCAEQTQELEAYLDELDPIEREMEAARVDAETEREKALNNIKSLVKEWKDLQAKFESGTQLTGTEQQRFEELKGLFGEEDEKYQDNIDSTTRNFTKISAKLSLVNAKADTAFDFGSETIAISQELAEFEKTSKNRSVFGGLIGAGIAGVLGAVGLAGSKRFSQTAHTIGLNTQYFADDVNTTIKEVQLLMQDTADTADFDLEDPSYTVEPLTKDEGITEPTVKTNSKKSTEGVSDEPASPDVAATDVETPAEPETQEPVNTDGTDPSTTDGTRAEETSEEAATDATEEEQTDEETMAEGESTLEDVNAKSLSLPKLKRLIKEEGVDSEKKGKDALKLVEQLKTQSAVVEEKEEQVEEDTTEVKETSEAEPAEGSEGTDNEGAMEEAQAGAEESQNDLTEATEEEALTVEGLRETFKASTKANKKYSKDVDEADKKMKESIYTGSFTIAGGGYMTGVGIYNVVQGTALLSAAGWWNPFVIAIATYMINTGAMEIGLGATMIDGGTALTVSATEGLEINKEADEKIGLSDEDITAAGESLDEIEREQKGEVEGQDGETKETEETDDTEEPTEDETLNKDTSLLDRMYTGNEELPPQRSLVLDDGKKSSAIGKENVSKLTTLERSIPSLIETTIEFEQAKQEEAAQSADPEGADSANSVQDPAEIYAEYRQDYNADLVQNKEFEKDITITNQNAKENLGLAAEGTAAGTARTALGANEIAIGTVLAAQWWNPVAMLLGLSLIKKGTEDTALGTEMLAVGLALTVNSTTTLAAGAISSNQVSDSNEKTTNALNTVDSIEAEINSAVQEQLAAQGEQDLSGMSTIQLLTLIINNGINASVAGTENTEIIETLKSQLPQLIENAAPAAQEEEVTDAVNNEDNEPKDEAQGEGQVEGEGESEDSVLTQYKNDFKTDLDTNERYSSEIDQARNMSPILKTSFFFGAPVEKATNRIKTSNEQTTTALEQVEEMEAQIKEAQEAKREAEEAEETENPDDKETKAKKDEEITPENAEDSVGNAEDDEQDADQENKKNANVEKKTRGKIKTNNKKLKKTDKQAKKSDKEAKLQDKEGVNNAKQGEEEAQKANPDSAQGAADQTATELAEAEAISAEVTGIVAEVQDEVAETKSEVDAATAENESIVAEMTAINMELQQDQTKMDNFEAQLKQEENKNKASSPAQTQPQAQKEEPQPVAQPKKSAKIAPKKQPKVEAEKPEEPKNAPATQQPAPAAKPQPQDDAEPTVQNAPEGADKTEFASDKEKQPDFVGFVAQSDSLASGSVFVSNNKKKTTNNQPAKSGNGVMGMKAAANKKTKQADLAAKNKAKKEAQKAQNAQPQEEGPQIVAAKRKTQKPFDISQMQGGNGGGKTQQIRTSMEAVRTAAFNKQARLNDMQIRANNNVMANIQKEALAQANAAKKERLAREKQERIAKIKEYAGYVQMVGGLTTTAGMIVTKVGTAQSAAGTAQITAGTAQVTAGTLQVTTGTAQVTLGTTMTTTGTAQVAAGTAQVAAGTAQVTSGTTMTTTGTTMIATGTPMLSNPFTAAAGAALVSTGTALVSSGSALIGTGTTMIATGMMQEVLGNTSIATGSATITTGSTQIAAGNAQIAAGNVQIATGTTQYAAGTALAATGATIQTVGTIVTAAGAATSAGADIANGNILGGIASIIGAAASVVGVTAPVSQLGNAAIQLGSQGVALAGQLTTSGAGQNNNNQQQDQKKKKKFKENQRTQGIIAKTQNRKQAVGNRFNK